MSDNEIWSNLNRMQIDCMASGCLVSRDEFFSETKEEQRRYYNWMREQVGPITRGPRWY